MPNLAVGKGFQLCASVVSTLKGMIIRMMGYVCIKFIHFNKIMNRVV